MAIKEPFAVELTETLEGEDAERLVAYVREPNPPEGHSEFLTEADKTFAAVYSRQSASELFH